MAENFSAPPPITGIRRKLGADEARHIRDVVPEYQNSVPTLVKNAVLKDPSLQERARREVREYIFIHNTPDLARAAEVSPLEIVDLRRDEKQVQGKYSLRETLKRRIDPAVLKHKVDVLNLFPQWVVHRRTLTDGKIIQLASPIVSIDPTRYFDATVETLNWLRQYKITGAPKVIAVLPDDWIIGDAKGHADHADESILITDSDGVTGGLHGSYNKLRHEVNHAAMMGDKAWGWTPSRSLIEGSDLVLEMEQSQERARLMLSYQARTFVGANPDIRRIAGFSSDATYKANNIQPINGEYILRVGERRAAEYFQGTILMWLVKERGGMQAFQEVYTESAKKTLFSQSEEQIIERSLKKGLRLNDQQLRMFKDEYIRLCGFFLNRSGNQGNLISPAFTDEELKAKFPILSSITVRLPPA